MALMILVLLGAGGAAAGGDIPNDLDAFAERVLEAFDVPGMAVAVVKDGEVVVAKGYGVRTLGQPEPVDENTIFAIASNTKAFTAAAMAMLVDEGKLDWDDPVIDHLPWFQMYDPYVTREITIRDLLTHRAGLGLGAGDLLFWPSTTYTTGEIIRRIRHIRPATSFRSSYAYDNILYNVAGEVIREVTGTPWDETIRSRIFAPLGMTRSSTSTTSFLPGDNVATPHARAEGKLIPTDYMVIDNNAPAGAINSCVSEMASWMIVQLAEGRIDAGSEGETRIFSEEQSRKMWSGQTIRPVNPDPPPSLKAIQSHFNLYGLGWGLSEYRGRKTVSHTGGLMGMLSRVILVPELDLGVVVLTNQEAGGAFMATSTYILDGYLGAPPTDWIAAFLEADALRKAKAEKVVAETGSSRNADSRPSLDLAAYAGTYRDAWYGDVVLTLEGNGLVVTFTHTPLLVGDLEHWQYDSFLVRWRKRDLNADAYVSFALRPDGSIDNMKIVPASPLVDFSFDFQDLYLVPVAEAEPTD